LNSIAAILEPADAVLHRAWPLFYLLLLTPVLDIKISIPLQMLIADF
jgi:hypothetical protein